MVYMSFARETPREGCRGAAWEGPPLPRVPGPATLRHVRPQRAGDKTSEERQPESIPAETQLFVLSRTQASRANL